MEFLIGIFVGGLLYWLFIDHKKPSGKLIIDFRDIDKPPLNLKLDEHIDDIWRKKSIVLKVETHDYESQE
jgi:hypothetical protein